MHSIFRIILKLALVNVSYFNHVTSSSLYVDCRPKLIGEIVFSLLGRGGGAIIDCQSSIEQEGQENHRLLLVFHPQ